MILKLKNNIVTYRDTCFRLTDSSLLFFARTIGRNYIYNSTLQDFSVTFYDKVNVWG